MHRAILSLSQNNLNVQLVISESRKLRIADISSVYYKKRWLNLRENLPIICLSLLNYTYAYGCEG